MQGEEFTRQRLQQAAQEIVVRESHPVLKAPTAQALSACEWVLTQPIAAGQQPRIAAMFAVAGVEPPARVVVGETLAALSLLRNADTVSIMPRPLLGHPETRGLVPVPDCGLRPCDIELLLLTRPDVPLTPAAAYFAHCLGQAATGSA